MRDRTEDQIKLVFIRHGATQENYEKRYLGRTEASLSREGIRELLYRKRHGVYPDADCLFASPMKRCRETAKLLYPDAEVQIIPEWTEMDFGDFEGKNYQELKNDAAYQSWIDSLGTLPFPGGESREMFVRRCGQGFEKMLILLEEQLKKAEKEPMTAVLIVHGGTIMSVLSSYGGGGYFDYQVKSAQGYVCTLQRGKADIRLINIEPLV